MRRRRRAIEGGGFRIIIRVRRAIYRFRSSAAPPPVPNALNHTARARLNCPKRGGGSLCPRPR